MINFDKEKVYPLKYELYIEAFVRSLDDNIIFGKFHKVIDNNTDMENIKNDPLNNFLKYDVKEIIYIHITYYPIYILNDYEIKDLKGVEVITAKSKSFNKYKNKIENFLIEHEKQAYNEIT